MDDCKTIRALLALRPQEWDADESKRIKAHLAICPDCADCTDVYAEQDRLIHAMPRVNLTLSQREQLLLRISRERRRHGMHTKLSAIFGTVTTVAALIVMVLGVNFLFRHYVQSPLDAPSGSYPTNADQALWAWIDTARDKNLAHQTTTILQRQPWWDGEVILFTYEDNFADGGRQRMLSWVLAEPDPSISGWVVTAWGNRDVVHWPVDQEIPAPVEVGVYTFWLSERGDSPDRAMSVIYGLRHRPEIPPETVQLIRNGQPTDVSLHNDSLLYITEGGLIEERPGIRWACDVLGNGWCAVGLRTDGQITMPEPLVFGGEIKSDNIAIDSLTGKIVPFTIGERDHRDPFAPGQLYTPANVQWMLTWIVVAPPSADWVVFAHLMNEAGELVMQSDVPVDWPAQPCLEGEYGLECVAVTEHEWYFPASFPPGLYTIQVGMYDPVTGKRASITSPAGVDDSVPLGQVRVSVSAQDLESALASQLIDDPTSLCEWQVWGQVAQEMYLWVVCESARGSAISAPAVVRIEQDEGGDWYVREVEVPRDGTFYGPDVRVLFPPDVQERIFAHDFDAEAAMVRIAERRAQMESVESLDEFAIYLVDLDQGMSALDALQVNLSELALADTPILATDDMISYDWETHAITLTYAAYERLSQLQVPVAPGVPFVVCVGNEPIYRGMFWGIYSSASFDGIAIVLPPREGQPIRIQLGYPESPELFTGEDLRADPRILQALTGTGKLDR